MKKVITCVGTRPNFIKVTQLQKHFDQHTSLKHQLLHTGQHFDQSMSQVFFDELGIKKPDIHLGIKAGSQLGLIAQIITELEKVLTAECPDLLMVPGDVNSSFACAFAANRLGIPVAHIESGLRSFDRTMPEEINRMMIDDLSELFFVTEPSGSEHLLAEQKPKSGIHYVGNTMIDTLVAFTDKIDSSTVLDSQKADRGNYALMTFHRPVNVDTADQLEKVVSILESVSAQLPVLFPIHPRTKKNLERFGLNQRLNRLANVHLLPSLGYPDFMHLVKNAKVVLTDSGGVQEETTFLRVPCLTVRPNTERPVTIEIGTNTLVDLDPKTIHQLMDGIMAGTYKQGKIPKYWDGKASERMVQVISEYLQ